MQSLSAPYPASLTFDPPEKVANWRVIGNIVLAIPHLIVLYIFNLVSEVVGLVSWLMILFTGKLPDGLANLQVLYLRYQVRTFTYVLFMREEYPPFSFDSTAADPGDDPRVRVDVVPELEGRNRLTAFFRIIMVIPQFIVLAFLSFAATIVTVIAWFVVLFTGTWPTGLRDFVVGVMRWSLRVNAYFLLLTDVYPPFALD